eukprot:5177536-Pyramimonas_sp.AAC.1
MPELFVRTPATPTPAPAVRRHDDGHGCHDCPHDVWPRWHASVWRLPGPASAPDGSDPEAPGVRAQVAAARALSWGAECSNAATAWSRLRLPVGIADV